MPKVKAFIDTDVLTEARKRMNHIYDTFDTVMVAFSGGKDSLVCLHLARQTALERGDDRPIKTIFRDEELIPDQVLDFVDEYRQMPWIDMRWYCLPWANTKFILGQTTPYVQWDPNREHMRPMPSYAITSADVGLGRDVVMDQYTTDTIAATGEKGKVAIITGVRTDESLMRFRALTVKLNDNYINQTTSPRIATVKPIFDWAENDVFRFFYDYQIRYCPIYDGQMWSSTPLRVSSPTHAESAKRIGRLRMYAPVFHDQVMQLLPEMAVQERYYAEFDFDALVAKYGQSLDGVERYIRENIENRKWRDMALDKLANVRGAVARGSTSFPPDHVLHQFMGGGYKRGILAL